MGVREIWGEGSYSFALLGDCFLVWEGVSALMTELQRERGGGGGGGVNGFFSSCSSSSSSSFSLLSDERSCEMMEAMDPLASFVQYRREGSRSFF